MFELLFAGWFQIALIILFITLAFIALIYMLASMLQNDNFKKWAHNEIYQVIASAFLLGSILIFFGIIDNIMINLISLMNPSLNLQCSATGCTFLEEMPQPSFLGSQDAFKLALTNKQCDTGYCHIEIAKSLMSKFYNIISFYTANKVVDIGWVTIFKSIKLTVSSSWSLEPLAGLQPIVDVYDSFLSYIFYILLWLKTNEIFLTFVSVALFPSFIAAGIAFRSISLVRNTGGLLLSIAFGTFFVYPMLLIFITSVISPDPQYHVIVFSDSAGFTANLPQITDSGTATVGNIISSSDYSASRKDSSLSILSFFEKLFSFMIVKTSDGNTYNILSYMLLRSLLPNGFLDSIAFLSVWIIVPAVISIYGTIIFVKEFSKFLGGDATIAGLSKLI